MGVVECVLFSEHSFLFRRVAVARVIPNLWITPSTAIVSQHRRLGLYKPPFSLGNVDVMLSPDPISPAHHFCRTGLYASDMSELSHNLQIRDVIDAMAQADPDLFDNETATLMPVEHHDKLDIAICDAHLNNLTPYDAPTPAPETATTAIVGRMHRIARWHGALQANFECELFGAPLALSLA